MSNIETLKQWIEVLENCTPDHVGYAKLRRDALASMRQALAEQPAQQQEYWEEQPDGSVIPVDPSEMQPAQPQQEPVGTYGEIFESMRSLLRSGRQADQQIYMAMQCKPLYTSPPAQRKPLTDEQIVASARVLNQRMAEQCGVDADDQWALYADDFKADARAVLEAANGIKGDA